MVWDGKLKISDTAGFLRQVADSYDSNERVLMEYIDNSLDDADDLATKSNGIYPYVIRLQIVLDTKRREIKLIDNCRGMKLAILERLVQNVAESKKKGLSWVNGQFGFGVHAFRKVAHSITFETKNADDQYYYLKFNREQTENIAAPKIKDRKFPSDTGTGTMVTLTGFESGDFEELTAQTIKDEIELHFERLLSKPNLEVTIVVDGHETIFCKAFDYESITGKEFKRTIPVDLDGVSKNIELCLKITETITHRQPTFFLKGRRIAPISDIKSFISNSKHRTGVWGNNYLIGYIEANGIVEPVITRDDFKKENRRLFYQKILELEDEIKSQIDELNKK